MTDRVDEAGAIGSLLKRAGARFRDGMLSGFGSQTAQGRLDTQNTFEKLKREFGRWRGQHRQPATIETLNDFLLSTYNYSLEGGSQNDDDQIAPEEDQGSPDEQPHGNEGNTSPEPSEGQPEGNSTPSNGSKDKKVDLSGDVDDAILRLKTHLYVRKPAVPSATMAIQEIMDSAKNHGGESKEKVAQFIRELQNDKRITSRYQFVNDIDIASLMENLNRYTACAAFLVENDVRGEAVKGVVEYFLAENFRTKKLSSTQQDTILRQVASDMIRNGMVDFKYRKDAPKPQGSPSARYRDDSRDGKKRDFRQGLNREKFAKLLREHGVSSGVHDDIDNAFRKSGGDIHAMKSQLDHLDNETIKAVMISLLGALE